MTPFKAGDIGAETNGSTVARLIQFGQRLRRKPGYRWNHIFVVTDDNGSTIEALGRGVVASTVGTRTVLNLGCPAGVDPVKVVDSARSYLGRRYNYIGVVALGVDALLGTNLRWRHNALFCSELGVLALQAGGWPSPKDASEMYPADVVDDLAHLLGTRSGG